MIEQFSTLRALIEGAYLIIYTLLRLIAEISFVFARSNLTPQDNTSGVQQNLKLFDFFMKYRAKRSLNDTPLGVNSGFGSAANCCKDPSSCGALGKVYPRELSIQLVFVRS